jgi:hypothetical protein
VLSSVFSRLFSFFHDARARQQKTWDWIDCIKAVESHPENGQKSLEKEEEEEGKKNIKLKWKNKREC